MDIIEIIELNASVRAQWADAQFKVERGWIDRDREYKWRVRQCNVRTAHSTERTSIKIFQDCLPNSIACKAIHIFVQCYSWKVKKLIQTRLFTHVIPSIITVPLKCPDESWFDFSFTWIHLERWMSELRDLWSIRWNIGEMKPQPSSPPMLP